jgi:sterol desaturase/sphingolipid hydroxylase (fatty acid hydroxylase superfamily)
MNFIQENEATIRLSVFLGTFLTMAVWELLLPRKKRSLPRKQRWVTNWGLVVIDSITLRLLVPVLAVGMAQLAAENGWGLLNWFDLPFFLGAFLSIVLLDMLIYWQHVASHHFQILWRFHKVHHADRDLDVTTGARFHPIEILLSMIYKLACIMVLGAPAIAVFCFEVLLNASAMFNHSNIRIGVVTDRLLRRVVVTPDMHRVHHSILVEEANSNYGFFLPFWDKLFGTYIDQPKHGHKEMIIGLREFQDEEPAALIWSLKAPFIKAS